MAPQLQRILIVDPNPASNKLLQELLRSLVSCQVWTAASDGKAIQAAGAIDPQILFIENTGPELDGARLTGSCAGASHRPEACSNRGKGAGALCGAR
jgi:CheY-like chemotaxis protein